jgi:hypothetical protein
MKNLQLAVLERITLLQAIPQGGTLAQVATYLRILEVLRLKEDEQKEVGWQENDNGTVTVQNALREFAIVMEDADFTVLAQIAAQWNEWPVAPVTLVLKEKLGL